MSETVLSRPCVQYSRDQAVSTVWGWGGGCRRWGAAGGWGGPTATARHRGSGVDAHRPPRPLRGQRGTRWRAITCGALLLPGLFPPPLPPDGARFLDGHFLCLVHPSSFLWPPAPTGRRCVRLPPRGRWLPPSPPSPDRQPRTRSRYLCWVARVEHLPPPRAVWLYRHLLFFLLLTTAAVWRPHASWMRMCRRRPWCMACGGYVGSGARRAWEGGMGKRRGSCGDEDRGGLLMAEERVCIADDGERGGGGGSGMFLVFRRSGVTMFAGPVFPEELCPVTMHFRLARGHPAGLFGTSHADSASYAVPVPSVFVSLPCSFASV